MTKPTFPTQAEYIINLLFLKANLFWLKPFLQIQEINHLTLISHLKEKPCMGIFCCVYFLACTSLTLKLIILTTTSFHPVYAKQGGNRITAYIFSANCTKNFSSFLIFPSSFLATDDHFHLFKVFLKPFNFSSLLNTQVTCKPLPNYQHNAAYLGILIILL